MPQAALNALLFAYRVQIDWLSAQAEEFEKGHRKVLGRVWGAQVDMTASYADEYRHKAGNMQAILEVFSRLHPDKGLADSQS